MIQTREVESKLEWNKFMSTMKTPISFFQSWNWGEFEKEMGNRIIRLGFYQEENLLAAVQLIFVYAKRGKFLHARNGPMIHDWSDKELVNKIINSIKDLANKHKMDFCRISPLVPYNDEAVAYLKKQGGVFSQIHDVDAEITWILDLNQTEEEILENMRKNTRYSINKAKRDGVEIEVSEQIEDLKKFWPIYQDTVTRNNWSAYNFSYIEKEFEQFIQDKETTMFLAKYQDKYIAASIFIYQNNEVYYHHSGTLSEYRKVPAAYLLQWESIKYAKRIGCTKYNFFGISRDDNPNHPWQGLTFFKKGFGGYEQRSMHSMDFPISVRYWLTFGYEYLERKKRGY